MQKRVRHWLLLGGVVLGLALLAALTVVLLWLPQRAPAQEMPDPDEVAWGAASPFADTVTAHPGMAPHERLEAPSLSDPPTQIEMGHLEYWMSCMVCHGDRGQGLTEEWRSVLDPADMNCWQSKCHAPNHPPEGFEIPRTSPLVMGPGALTGYRTAQDLYGYLRVDMPWSFPGLFQDRQYWWLTAYLLDANGVDLGKALPDAGEGEALAEGGTYEGARLQEPLGPDNAAEILLIPGLVQTHRTPFKTEQAATVVVVGLFLFAAAGYWRIRTP